MLARGNTVVLRGQALSFERINASMEGGPVLQQSDVEAVADTVSQVQASFDGRIATAISRLAATHGLDDSHACSTSGEAVTGIVESGRPVCASFAPDFDEVQARVRSSCASGAAIREILRDGSVVCEDAAYAPDLDVLQRRLAAACSGKQCVRVSPGMHTRGMACEHRDSVSLKEIRCGSMQQSDRQE